MSMNTVSSTLPDRGQPASGIVGVMKQALADGELSDVRFTVGRHFDRIQDFSAHKFVLGSRSAVFRAMLFGQLSENHDNAVEIPDIPPEAFAIMLSFLYTDAVDNLSADNVFGTLKCADKYDLPQLVDICSEFIRKRLNPDNCLDTLKEALDWQAEKIVKKCRVLVEEKTSAVLRSEEFVNISLQMLQDLLQLKLQASENDIYLAVERWAAAACARNGMDASAANRRQVLRDALFLVRFPLLDNKQLADGPGQSGLLTDTEMRDLFMYLNAAVKPEVPFPTEKRIKKQLAVKNRTLYFPARNPCKRSAEANQNNGQSATKRR
ncbi:BTB/POZ domain-containing protein 6-B-like [Paramacrobiotus metropolitanus]|uniref:BTB/POZ domain-containing protein 6-B-like n=1 Tax=Paramacrobiotus metropolitanus TaxID=2943436 RepID=UPI0024463BCB|nr:BTB/POZ domain-containing protein 6-B-like [Paramacrobiotus metropolitanus]